MARSSLKSRRSSTGPANFRSPRRRWSAAALSIVGSSISDNRRVDAPRGSVRAFDVRTGRARWSWDPLIHDGIQAGGANVWAPMSADDNLGLVFLPTSSPSPDFFGGKRPGNNDYANSVVALRSETGERVWSFQTVHHDVWDYDLPAQPTLARIDTGDGPRDVVIQATKQGFLFVLDRSDRRSDLAGRGTSRSARRSCRANNYRRRNRFQRTFRFWLRSRSLRMMLPGCRRFLAATPAARSSRRCATKGFTRRRRRKAPCFFR